MWESENIRRYKDTKLLHQKGYATIALELVIAQLIAKAKKTIKTVVDVIILSSATGTQQLIHNIERQLY